MLVDRYEPEDVFARVPELASQTDLVLRALDELLDDDNLYQQVRVDLNPIKPKWVHGKRNVVETYGLLITKQLAERVCAYYETLYEPHLIIPEKVA